MSPVCVRSIIDRCTRLSCVNSASAVMLPADQPVLVIAQASPGESINAQDAGLVWWLGDE